LLAVAQYQEAMELSDSGIDVPILIFGRLFPDELPDAIRAGISDQPVRHQMTSAGSNVHPATMTAHVHVNVETGMGAGRVLLEREPEFSIPTGSFAALRLGGCTAISPPRTRQNKSYAREQLNRFNG
jgi:alanine racemase